MCPIAQITQRDDQLPRLRSFEEVGPDILSDVKNLTDEHAACLLRVEDRVCLKTEAPQV